MNRLSLAWTFSAALLMGCGGNVSVSTGGSGGDGGGGAGGTTTGTTNTITTTTGTTNTTPAECMVPTNQPGPYPIEIQFVVKTNQPSYIVQDCYTQYTVTSCVDGYQAAIGLHGDCTVDCSESMGCIDCGACPYSAVAVGPNAPYYDKWSGEQFVFGTNQAGCTCHDSFDAPPGKYRINVPVYKSEQDALMGVNASVVGVDFTLPAPNGTVVVPIDLAAN